MKKKTYTTKKKQKEIDANIYDLKYHIADFIAPRLKRFKEGVDTDSFPTQPIFENFPEGASDLEVRNFWSERLEEMLFSFEYLSHEEKFEHLSFEVKEAKFKKGLETFAKYFEKLWV